MTLFDVATEQIVTGSSRNHYPLMDSGTGNIRLKGNGQTGEIAIDEAAYIKSTEWEIVSKTGTIHEVSYDCCPQVYQGPFVSTFYEKGLLQATFLNSI